MTRIALTGGIGSGKSTIAQQLRELGAVTFDADRFAREAVEPGQPALAEISARFGPAVLNADGSLNREKLGEIVFHDAAKLRELEAMIHPRVRELAERSFAEVERDNPGAVIVYELPLLVETGATEGWDEIVLADAPAAIRVKRLQRERGMTEAEALARVGNQSSDEQRRRIATRIIDTATSRETTRQQVRELWEALTRAADGER